MYMFFLEGRNGFYCSDGNKIYFPDRSVEMKSPVVRVDKIRDKGNYAFVLGESIDKESILSPYEVIERGIVSLWEVRKIFNNAYWVDEKSGNICACINGKVEVVYEKPEIVIGNEHYSHKFYLQLMKELNPFECNIEKGLSLKFIKGLFESAEDFDLEKHFEETLKYFQDGCKGMVHLYKGKLLIIKSHIYSSFCFSFLSFNGELKILPMRFFPILKDMGVLGKGVSVEEFYIEKGKKYNICYKMGEELNNEYGVVATKRKAMGQVVEVSLFACNLFSFEKYEKHKDFVQEQVDNYEAFRKKVAAGISSKSVGVLRDLSIYDWQFNSFKFDKNWIF